MRGLRAVVLLVLVLVLVAAAVWFAVLRGGDDTTTPDGRAPAGDGGNAAEITKRYLPTAANADQPVAGADGTISSDVAKVPARADVLALVADDASTTVRWRLSTAAAGTSVDPGLLSNTRGAPDTSAVSLYSPEQDLELYPGHWTATDTSITLGAPCTCSKQPFETGPAGVELSGVYQALPDDVASIQVKIPGFPAITVPVTRR